MAAKKKCSALQKEHYKTYATQKKWAKNRKLKLLKYIKNNPRDQQAKKALEKVELMKEPRRSKGHNGGICKVAPHNIFKTWLPQISIADQFRALTNGKPRKVLR